MWERFSVCKFEPSLLFWSVGLEVATSVVWPLSVILIAVIWSKDYSVVYVSPRVSVSLSNLCHSWLTVYLIPVYLNQVNVF